MRQRNKLQIRHHEEIEDESEDRPVTLITVKRPTIKISKELRSRIFSLSSQLTSPDSRVRVRLESSFSTNSGAVKCKERNRSTDHVRREADEAKYERILTRHTENIMTQARILARVQARGRRLRQQEEEAANRTESLISSVLLGAGYEKVMRETRSGERRQIRVRRLHNQCVSRLWKNVRIAGLAKPKYCVQKYSDIMKGS